VVVVVKQIATGFVEVIGLYVLGPIMEAVRKFLSWMQWKWAVDLIGSP